MKLTVAGAQIQVTESINENMQAINRGLLYAKECRADILLTPEGLLSGYHNKFRQKELDEALVEIRAKAKSNETGLALGTCFYERDELCYNQLRFYNEESELIGYHAKILLCSSVEPPFQGEGDYFASKPLESFYFKGTRIGGLLCNDMWANPTCTPMPDPHLSQQLSAMGTKVIFHGVNGWRDESVFIRTHQLNYHESNLLLRAVAGKVWIVSVDNAWPLDTHVSCYGGVVSPEGERMLKAEDKGEQFFCYTIDLKEE